MSNRNVGLYFGSFNPLHMGHMILANYMVENTSIDQLWFVVSPQNPFKKRSSLLDEIHRYAIVERSIEDDDRFRVSNIEFSLAKPSYTIDTLVALEEKYPEINFSLIMGQDNLKSLHKWKNIDELLSRHQVYVYPREGLKRDDKWIGHDCIKLVDAPQVEMSASEIRNNIKEGKDVKWYLPEKAWDYIQEMNFYKNP